MARETVSNVVSWCDDFPGEGDPDYAVLEDAEEQTKKKAQAKQPSQTGDVIYSGIPGGDSNDDGPAANSGLYAVPTKRVNKAKATASDDGLYDNTTGGASLLGGAAAVSAPLPPCHRAALLCRLLL